MAKVTLGDTEIEVHGVLASEDALEDFIGRLVQAADIVWPQRADAAPAAEEPATAAVGQEEAPLAPSAIAGEPKPEASAADALPLKKRRVLELTNAGVSVREISDKLALAPSTITNIRVELRKAGLL